MLHFDPATGCYPDKVSDVRDRVRQEWIEAFRKEGQPELDVDPETPAGQLIDSQTAHIAEKDNEILFLANQFNPLSAEGIWQDALGKIYFLSRHLAQSSVAVCQVTGLQGTVIPIGAQIRSTVDGTTWLNSKTITIPSTGRAEGIFICSETGPIQAKAETLTSIVTITPGWDDVTNPAAATLGRHLETQIEFEQRRFESVAANARGSVHALYGALANLKDVISCVVLENIYNVPIIRWGVTIPGHSVWIAILGGDDDEIGETIYRKKDCGCGTAGNTEVTYTDKSIPGEPQFFYRIERPKLLEIKVQVTLEESPSIPSNIESLIKKAVVDDFNGNGPHGVARVGIAQNLFSSRFFCCVREAGATTLKDIKLATSENDSWQESLVIRADRAPVISEDDVVIELDEVGNAGL